MRSTQEFIEALNILVNFLETAQKRGAFSLAEANAIVTAVADINDQFSNTATDEAFNTPPGTISIDSNDTELVAEKNNNKQQQQEN